MKCSMILYVAVLLMVYHPLYIYSLIYPLSFKLHTFLVYKFGAALRSWKYLFFKTKKIIL